MTVNPRYTEQQLKQQLNYEAIEGEQYYYSIANKVNNSGWGKNQRMIIFHQNSGNIYYTDISEAPFKQKAKIPVAKKGKDTISIYTSLFIYIANSEELKIQFGKVDNNKEVMSEWVFIFMNKELAGEWHKLISERKVKKFEVANVSNNDKNKNQNLNFLHNTINFAMLPKEKEQPPRVDIIEAKGYQNVYKANSHIQRSNSPVHNSTIKNTHPENVNNSRLSLKSQVSREEGQRSKIPQINEAKFINLTESALRKSRGNGNDESRIRGSQVKPINESNKGIESRISEKEAQEDWNYQFYKNADDKTIYEFQIFSERVFMSVLKEQKFNSVNQVKRFHRSGVDIFIADIGTNHAAKLKAEFRNYHFILEATQFNLILGVPLTSLIQFQGLVGLVKSPIPKTANKISNNSQILPAIRELERYTRIKTDIFIKPTNTDYGCGFYDITSVYGNQKSIRILFVDNLLDYLPINLYEDRQITFQYTLRSQYILDNVNYVILGGTDFITDKRNTQEVNKSIERIVKNIAVYLSNQQFVFANIDQLKNFLHSNGINLKFLPLVYRQVTNRSVKKYIHTCMAAKAAKDSINKVISISSKQGIRKKPTSVIIQDIVKNYIESGGNINTEQWKELTLDFRKQYKISLNSHDIIPGFFLNSLIILLKIEPDIRKIDRNKTIFKDDKIIAQGLVKAIKPKVKSYWRYKTQILQNINTLLDQQSEDNYQQILQILKQNYKGQLPPHLSLKKTDQKILQYFMAFIPPKNMAASSLEVTYPLYDIVNQEPPTSFNITATKMYLKYALQYNKMPQFKKTIEQSLKIIDYWFYDNHPYHIDLYDCMVDYYQNIGNLEESVNISKQALVQCIKSGTRMNKLLGQKCFLLAEKELRLGRKADSLDNFNKAKTNMEQQPDKSQYYPLTLMNLSLLYLNNGEINKCIEYGLNAQKNFQQNTPLKQRQYERQFVKNYEILCRAYEISNMSTDLKDVGIRCSRKKTQDPIIFEQMLRICATGAICKLSLQKAQCLINCLQRIKQSQEIESGKGLNYLMSRSLSENVMQKFINKIDNVEKIWSDLSSKKALSPQSKDILTILVNLSSAIGEEFLSGLVQQKQYE